jgi:hypothetical protein
MVASMKARQALDDPARARILDREAEWAAVKSPNAVGRH